MSVLLSLTGPQITFTAIHYVQWNKTFIQSHVLFLGKYLFLQAPDIFSTISTSLRGPGLPAQKVSPAGLGGIMPPCSMTLLGQVQASQCLMAAANTVCFPKGNHSGAFLVFLVISPCVIVTGTLSAGVRTVHYILLKSMKFSFLI